MALQPTVCYLTFKGFPLEDVAFRVDIAYCKVLKIRWMKRVCANNFSPPITDIHLQEPNKLGALAHNSEVLNSPSYLLV